MDEPEIIILLQKVLDWEKVSSKSKSYPPFLRLVPGANSYLKEKSYHGCSNTTLQCGG